MMIDMMIFDGSRMIGGYRGERHQFKEWLRAKGKDFVMQHLFVERTKGIVAEIPTKPLFEQDTLIFCQCGKYSNGVVDLRK